MGWMQNWAVSGPSLWVLMFKSISTKRTFASSAYSGNTFKKELTNQPIRKLN